MCKIFRARPYQPGTQQYSYTKGTGSFPEVNLPGRGVENPPTSSTEVKERVELYLYCPSDRSWPVLVRNFLFIICISLRLNRIVYVSDTVGWVAQSV